VSHRGSAPRSATFAVDSSSTLAAVVARSADEGAAPPDALRRSPVVRALRDKFEGAALERTLASLGYGAGASVRLNIDLGAVDEGAVAPPPEKRPRDEAAPAPAAAVPAPAAVPARAARAPPPAAPAPAAPVPAAAPMDTDAPADALGDALAAVGAVGGAAGAACAALLARYVDGVLANPKSPKHRAIRRGNAAFAQRIEAVGGERVLAALGFHAEDRGGEPWLALCDDGARDLAALKRAKAALAALCAAPAPVAVPAFDPFSTHRVDMRSGAAKKATVPSETAVERRARELGDQARALEGAAVAPERSLTLRSAAAQDAAAAKARADARFGGSADDGAGRGDSNLVAKAAAARERSRREKEDAPMTTKAMRDVAALEKLRVYDVAAIKVQFPDRTVMGARFHPREPVAAVYAAVRGVLAPGAPDFALFVSPPKRDLPPGGGTLADLGLVPAAKVFVSWASPATGPYLSDASLALLDADVAASAFPEAKPVAERTPAAAEPAAAAKPKAKKPSWMKLG